VGVCKIIFATCNPQTVAVAAVAVVYIGGLSSGQGKGVEREDVASAYVLHPLNSFFISIYEGVRVCEKLSQKERLTWGQSK
jgi:hypothetical protein